MKEVLDSGLLGGRVLGLLWESLFKSALKILIASTILKNARILWNTINVGIQCKIKSINKA